MARYAIVRERSEVWIDATSSLHPIRSRTTGLEGFLDLEVQASGRVDLGVPPKAELSLPVGALSSGNQLEDRELHRRIDARRFPTIDGRLTDMRAVGSDGRYVVRGEITFRGVTRLHEDEMTIARLDDSTLQVDGSSTFDIRDFGMEPPRILMLKVHPEVTVKVAIVATREG